MKRTLKLFSFSMILALLVGLAGIHIPPAQAAPGETTLISLSNSASPMDANNSSFISTISADGQFVAFQSYASSLVSGDTNGLSDIFVRDLQNGLTERVSTDSNGLQGNSTSFQPAISADGRFVAFRSEASNLAGSDTNGKSDIFVHDRLTDITERISIGLNGAATNFESYEPSISGDGRFIAFVSFATNLVEGDTNNTFDVFVRDRQTGQTERVSIDSNGTQANNPSYQPAISSDGRLVTFVSAASNLVAGDTNGNWDIFVHDRETDLTERVSVDSNGNQGSSFSYAASISADGQFVAFVSAAMLVSGDTVGTQDIFVHDRQSGLTERIAFGPPGTGPAHDAYFTSISAEGRYVTFPSYAANLVSGDTNGKADIFVHDRQLNSTERVSVDSGGAEANYHSYQSAISGDGQLVTFMSDAENLVSGDTNRRMDVFLHDRQTEETTRVSVGPVTLGGNSSSHDPSISADGRYVAFQSWATNLVSGDTNDRGDIFVRDRQTGVTERVSVHSNGAQANADSSYQSISGDGRFVVFMSFATNLVSGDTNGVVDIFVHDRQTDLTERVSVHSNGAQGNQDSYEPSISGDGRYVAFQSDSPNLVSGDTNDATDIFIHDRQTGQTELVSVGSHGAQGNNGSVQSSISADGRYVAFLSLASNLVSNDTNNFSDVFIRDRQTGSTQRVSVNSNGVEGNGDSYQQFISADGRYITFVSESTNLVSGDTNDRGDIFVHDHQTGLTERVSVDSRGTEAMFGADSPSISANGRYVVFASSSMNLVSGDTNHMPDVFIHDRQTEQTARVSVDSSGAQANGYTYNPSISANGQFIVFDSIATNLVSDDINQTADIFLHENDILPEPVRIYVDREAEGANDGTTWANAYTDLQLALARASSGDEIWVAAGTYKPTSTTNRSASFALKNEVAIYGGFNGTETVRTQRNYEANVTILSGDIGVAGDSSDNSYHVVLASSTNGSALLDGFTITAGNGNGDAAAQNNWGGGIFITNDGSPNLRNLILRENSAGSGAGLSMWGNPILTNVAFRNNTADLYGGGVYMYHGSAPSLNHVTFDHNSAGSGGGGLFTDEASYPTLMNLTFSHNSAPFGGGMSSGHGDITVTNATFYGNTADDGGAIFNAAYGTLYLRNVTISGNTGTSMGGVSSTSFSSTLTINNSIIYGNTGGNLYGAEEVTNSIVQGGYPGAGNLDLDPLLGALQDNGGFTQTMALGAGSPAINTGDAANCPAADQRGIYRPQGTRCDIGAYEYPFPLSPTFIPPTFLPSTPTSTPSRTPSPTPTPSATGSPTNTATATRTPTKIATYDPTVIPAGGILRVSIGSDRAQGNNDSYFPAISADGRYIVFNSHASNLVPGDTNGVSDIFIRDMHTNLTTRVSVDSHGIQGNGHSYRPVVTADGRYIAFDSDAANLVAGDINGNTDVFVHDRQTGETKRVSVHSNGWQGFGTSIYPSISADGRYIAFYSSAPDLAANDINLANDVFLHDRQTGETRRISEAFHGTPADNDSRFPSISADGRYIAFESEATNLIPGDTNGVIDIFRYDRLTGQILRISVDSYERQANGHSGSPSISADGRFIAFESAATNLVSSDTNIHREIFLHDTSTGITTLVSVDSNGLQASNSSFAPSISGNGRYIAFDSGAENLVPGDNNRHIDAFVHDRELGTTIRFSVSSIYGQGNGQSDQIVVSANGEFLVFTSRATNLVPSDTNLRMDVFVYRQAVMPLPLTPTPTFKATVTASPTQTPTHTPIIPPVYHTQTTTGVFRPSNGALYLKNRNETGFADVQINYGIGGDYPVVGDWDGDGVDTIGVYRNGFFYLRNENTIGFADVVFPFGMPGDQPVAGDWNGDGIDTIGVYRMGTFFLRNSNEAGEPEMIFSLGIPGDVGIAGDWDGDGKDSTGVFRPSNGALYLKHKNETGFADIQINYGITGDKPVTGDWDGDGVDTIGVYRNGTFYLRNKNTIGFADIVFALGIPGDHPIAGDWDGLP